MLVKYEDLEILVEHTYNMSDRQEFTMEVVFKNKLFRFFIEGYKLDPEEPATWKLHLQGTKCKKVIASMRDKDLYRDMMELIREC